MSSAVVAAVTDRVIGPVQKRLISERPSLKRAPAFCTAPTPDWRARLLQPLARFTPRPLHGGLDCGTPLRLEYSVVCVGNINAGGTARQPTVMAVVESCVTSITTPMWFAR